jgi:cytochrome oxidase assembly protein ShyY1
MPSDGGGGACKGRALYRHSVRSYRFVFTPKWLGFHALTWLVLIPAFIGLGQWQRDLWKDRDRSQGVVLSALAAKPVPLDSAAPAGRAVTQSQQWTMVAATGRYDTAHQFMVRDRSQNEQPGWYVVTPLVLSDGTAVLVNQGWVAESTTGGADQPPAFPPVPSGTVTVAGSLQPDETTATTRIRDDTAKLPAPEIALITTKDLASRVPYPLRDGSLRLASGVPANTGASAAAPIPNPTYDNSMYIAYMIQWWVFALVMPVTWLLLIRREAGDRRMAALEAGAGPDTDPDSDGAGPADGDPVPVAASAGPSAPGAQPVQ